ncbi:MAG: hypothetical protein OEY85_01710 [Rhodospirillales bacterium]|nr:hypothetical protein [Rhodospirillales bacterium]
MTPPPVTDPKVKAALERAVSELNVAAEEHRALSKRINTVVARLYDIEPQPAVRLQVDSLADAGDLHKAVSQRVSNVVRVINFLLTGGTKVEAKAPPPAQEKALSFSKSEALTPEQIKHLLGES